MTSEETLAIAGALAAKVSEKSYLVQLTTEEEARAWNARTGDSLKLGDSVRVVELALYEPVDL